MTATAQNVSAVNRSKGALIRYQERVKGVEDKLASSPRVLLQFTLGLDPFEQMTVATVAAKHFRRRQGQESARWTMSPLSLFWICRNNRGGCKSDTIL